MKIVIDIEKSEHNWAASCTDPALQGHFVGVTADTRREAIDEFINSLNVYFDSLKSLGLDAPVITSYEVHEFIGTEIDVSYYKYMI
jgi:hypothetical protein